MKILMLCPLLSSSSMITVYPMAKALSKKHDVRLVGPKMGKDFYINDRALDIEVIEPPMPRPLQAAMLSLYPRNIIKLLKEDYDIVHAFKLLPHTAPAASIAKKLRGKKFVLSIDDYDAASSRNVLKRLIMGWAEKSYKSADAITVSSSYLQKIYGGEVIYQVPNEALFINAKSSGKIKKHLGIEGKNMILYAGTFYEHKGIDVLIKAVRSLKRDDIRLVIAGSGSEEDRLRKMAGSETIFLGKLPMKNVAELTASCDIYAIPTKDTEYARAEIPGKIFEPMSLSKPIIASRISDIPAILGNGRCGLLAEPGDAGALARSIEYLIDNPSEAKKLAAAAKKRYFEMYSMKHFENKIGEIYGKLGDGA